MSQLVNPIQGKLTKMRNSQMIRFNTHSDSTPLKTQQWMDIDKQNNISACPLTHNSKNLNKKQSQSSLRKLSILERKTSQKQQSNSFLKNELSRRRKKYQDQLIETQEKYQKLLSSLEQELINQMKLQQQLDEQSVYLKELLQNTDEFSTLEHLNNEVLKQFEQKLSELGVIGHDLLYSVQTVMQPKRISPKLTQNRNPKYMSSPYSYSKDKLELENQEDVYFGNISISNSKSMMRETNESQNTLQKYWRKNQRNI